MDFTGSTFVTVRFFVIRYTLCVFIVVVCGADCFAVDFAIRQVADINPIGDASPGRFTEFNDLLYFTASGPNGSELYRSDGANRRII